MFKIFTVFLLLIATANAQSLSSYTIDVLIDGNKNIYFGESKVLLEDVPKTTRGIVDKLKFVEGKEITYRFFADGNLKLGDILDVQDMMFKGFSQPYIRIQKYLLKTGDIPADKSNWIEQLNKLDLKAIEH